MGMQYEWDFKIIKRIFDDEAFSKDDHRDFFCVNKTDINRFDITYKALNELEIISKEKLNQKYSEVFNNKNKDILANALAANIQEYRFKLKLLDDEIKEILNKDIYKSYISFKKRIALSSLVLIEKIDTFKHTFDEEVIENLKSLREKHFISINKLLEPINNLLDVMVINDKSKVTNKSHDNIKKFVKEIIPGSEEDPIVGYCVATTKKHYIVEYVLKDTIKFIIETSSRNIKKELDTKEIYSFIDNYEDLFDYDSDKQVTQNEKRKEKYLEGNFINHNSGKKSNIATDVINALYILKIIISEDKKEYTEEHKIPKPIKCNTLQYNKYRIIEILDHKYQLSLMTKVETIENLIPGISNLTFVSDKDIEAVHKILNYC